jgi:hypothetical protein
MYAMCMADTERVLVAEEHGVQWPVRTDSSPLGVRKAVFCTAAGALRAPLSSAPSAEIVMKAAGKGVTELT